MDRSNLNPLLLPAIALLALFLPLNASLRLLMPSASSGGSIDSRKATSADTERAAPDSAVAPPDAFGERTIQLLAEFVGLPPPPRDEKPAQTDKEKKAHRKRILTLLGKIKTGLGNLTQNGTQVEFLILTVPDPIDSRLDYFYDRNLDAAQRAIENAGYSLERYFLTWSVGASRTGKGSPIHSAIPGVILFRKYNASDNQLLIVFVVGETPTAGIHRQAMRAALEQIALFAGARPKTFPGFVVAGMEQPAGAAAASSQLKVRILGPTFSGSAFSLGVTLKNWLLSFPTSSLPHIRIVSGTATAIDQSLFLESLADHRDNISLTTTTLPDELTLRKAIAYLLEKFEQSNHSLIGQPLKVAILYEGNTDYGRALALSARASAPGIRLVSLPFPLHISQLRGTALKLKPLQSSVEKTPTQESNVPLQLGEQPQTNTQDVIPLHSSMELASTELVLGNILSTINREGIRHIGLFATDIRDQLFLAHELRTHCPNTLLFTSNADLLYLRPEVNADFQGLLLFSPYPLFNLNQRLSPPFDQGTPRIQFSSSQSQGIYNAALALLDQYERMLEYGYPLEENRLLQESPLPPPPLWVSVVGRDGFWPIKTLRTEESPVPQPVMLRPTSMPANQNSVPADAEGLIFTSITMTLALLFLATISVLPVLVLLPHLLLAWCAGKRRKHSAEPGTKPVILCLAEAVVARLRLERIESFRISQYFGIGERYKYGFDCRVYLFNGSVTLLTISLMASGIHLIPAQSPLFPAPLWQRIGAWSILAITVTTMVWLCMSIVQWMRQRLREKGPSPRWAVAYLLAGLGLASLAAWGLFELLQLARGNSSELAEAMFFYLRTTNPGNGVSILLPWIFINLALLSIAAANLRRLHLLERMHNMPRPPAAPGSFLRLSTDSFVGVATAEDRINRLLLLRPYQLPWGRVLSPAIVLFFAYLLLFKPVQFTDERGFDLFFKGAFLFVPLIILWTMLRFVQTWKAVKALLKRLSWHPIFHFASEEEEKQLRALPRLTITSPTPTYTALSFSLEEAGRYLRRRPAAAHAPARLAQLVRLAQKSLQRALEYEAREQWQQALLPRLRAQKFTSLAAAEIAREMEPHWPLHPDATPAAPTEECGPGRLFLLAHIGAYLQHIFSHMQTLISFVTISLLLSLVAIGSYPFHFRSTLLLLSWISILTTIALTFWIFLDASRDRTLSLLANTTPGQITLTRDLLSRLLLHVVLPLVALLGAQFPESLSQILAWFSRTQGGGS